VSKIVFLDTEFTGVHTDTTLISVGMVTLEGSSLYVTLNDYDSNQINDWIRDNVLSLIDESKSVSGKEACLRISKFLERYSENERISLVSAGKLLDITLLFQLWHSLYPETKYFNLKYLPPYLNHGAHFDLNTLFHVAGIDPDIDRNEFAGLHDYKRKHHALDDAMVVRKCFLSLVESGRMTTIFKREMFNE
jgi:DNA polymerase III epsilon subunit-like protein